MAQLCSAARGRDAEERRRRVGAGSKACSRRSGSSKPTKPDNPQFRDYPQIGHPADMPKLTRMTRLRHRAGRDHLDMQSDWQRDDAVETRASPREKLLELRKSVVEFHSHCAQLSHFSAALKKNHRQDEERFVPLVISQRKVRGGYRKRTARALPWRRFTICSARFRMMMPMT